MDVLNPAPGRVGLRKGNPSMADTNDTHRLAFVFDAGSYRMLQAMTRELGFETNAATIREALRILRAIQTWRDKGHSIVTVEDPATGESQQLMIEFPDPVAAQPAGN